MITKQSPVTETKITDTDTACEKKKEKSWSWQTVQTSIFMAYELRWKLLYQGWQQDKTEHQHLHCQYKISSNILTLTDSVYVFQCDTLHIQFDTFSAGFFFCTASIHKYSMLQSVCMKVSTVSNKQYWNEINLTCYRPVLVTLIAVG